MYLPLRQKVEKIIFFPQMRIWTNVFSAGRETSNAHLMDSLTLFWKKLVIDISESSFSKDLPPKVYVQRIKVSVYYVSKTRIKF